MIICDSELGYLDDPIYEKLSCITVKKPIEIHGFQISKNFKGFYEIASLDIHECASNFQQCYEKLTVYLDKEEKKDVMSITNLF